MSPHDYQCGGPSECDNNDHSDQEMVVALSTGWYSHGSRCLKNIGINANDNSILAKVVDECDYVNGCDPRVGLAQFVDRPSELWIVVGSGSFQIRF